MPGLRRVSSRLLVVALLASAGIAAAWSFSPSGPDLQARVTTLVASRGGHLLVPAEVPVLLAEAIVATEDERFYANHGVDMLGLFRSLLDDLSQRCLCEGGSTITEQLIKQVYLDGSDAGLHKPADIALALKIGLIVDKGTILADYLSVIALGRGVYGADQAACVYFDRPLGQLGLAGYALLAGMTQAPSLYDPRFDAEAALQRRGHVLSAMRHEGYITALQERDAGGQRLGLAPLRPGACGTTA